MGRKHFLKQGSTTKAIDPKTVQEDTAMLLDNESMTSTQEDSNNQIVEPITQTTLTTNKEEIDNISQQINNALKVQQEDHNRVWLPILQDKKRLKLEKEYYKISPKGVVYFDVLDQQIFFEETKRPLMIY